MNRDVTYHDKVKDPCSQTAQNPLQLPESVAANKFYKI